MGLSRRQFTREFKLAAVRRLEMGASIAEVARALEVNPNVLHRWRREFRDGPGQRFLYVASRSRHAFGCLTAKRYKPWIRSGGLA